jgi:PAS domain S-box-containing protein
VNMARLRAAAARELQAEMAQREAAHEGMRQRTAQFETLFRQAPIGVYLVDSDLRIREVNPVALPVFGDTPDLIGSDFGNVIRRLWTPDYAEEVIGRFRHTLETGEPYVTPERAEHRRDRGVVEFYSWRIDRIPLPEGRWGVVCYFRDISSQVLAERQLEEARDSALEASRAKDTFLATLSHELRTPLSPVLLLASEAGRDESLPERVRADFRMIGDNVALQARLIDDLLDLSRLSRGKLALELGPLDLHALLRDSVTTLEEDFRESGLAVQFDLRATSPRVNGDPVRLRQVVWNILKNAVKFTPRGGSILVSTQDSEGEVEVRVRDTGIGMKADDLVRIFQPFVQADATPGARPAGGMGLGLAISRMLVEGHGGTLAAESAGPGEGSTLVMRLPRGSALTLGNGVPGRETAAASASGETQRILFVEDNLATQATIMRLLARRGYLVTAAASVEEAMREAGGARFDVLISDLGLPDGDGCEVMTELRLRQPGLVGIAISGYGMAADVERSRQAGFREHLTKPVTFDALERALLRAMRASAMPWGRPQDPTHEPVETSPTGPREPTTAGA